LFIPRPIYALTGCAYRMGSTSVVTPQRNHLSPQRRTQQSENEHRQQVSEQQMWDEGYRAPQIGEQLGEGADGDACGEAGEDGAARVALAARDGEGEQG
jgi:hypothetical protein